MSFIYEAEVGQSFYDFIAYVQNEARLRDREIIARFNGADIRVYPGSGTYDLLDKFEISFQLLKLKGE